MTRKPGVILGDVNSKFDQVLEGHSVLSKELKDFRREHREDIGFLKFGHKVLSSEVSDIKIKLDRLEDKYDKNFDQILKYLSAIDEEIKDLKPRLTNKADLEQLQRLEQKVVQIELVIRKWQK